MHPSLSQFHHKKNGKIIHSSSNQEHLNFICRVHWQSSCEFTFAFHEDSPSCVTWGPGSHGGWCIPALVSCFLHRLIRLRPFCPQLSGLMAPEGSFHSNICFSLPFDQVCNNITLRFSITFRFHTEDSNPIIKIVFH